MLYPVILCGGSGTRLWPLSRSEYPKQFADMGNGRTLFEDTVNRVACITEQTRLVVVTNKAHRFYVRTSLKKLQKDANVIVEPKPRNTAPAIALAAFCAMTADPDAVLFVMPSDHGLPADDVFSYAVSTGSKLARDGYMVTFGIMPEYPATGYGYIKQGSELASGGYLVDRFVEKPDAALARAMLDAGGYTWNSGMFMFKASVYLSELLNFAPEIYKGTQSAWDKRSRLGEAEMPDEMIFSSIPSDSIDYAVMEHTTRAAMVPLNTDWSDLGSWQAMYEAGKKDSNLNTIKGTVFCKGVHGSIIQSDHRVIAAIGVNNMAIVDTKDALLIMPRERAQEVKDIAQQLQEAGRIESRQAAVVHKPWGSYESLTTEAGYQVKRLIVLPDERLSLQLHHHRSEHWTVVQGEAEITVDDKVFICGPNEGAYIPVEAKHRLRNTSSTSTLVVIEVQCGDYLGEDDIERFADDYQRV